MTDTAQMQSASKDTTIEIKRVSIVKNITLNFEAEEHENGTINKIKKECGHPIHDDLRNAMNRLSVHMALLTEIIELQTKLNIDEYTSGVIDKLEITGISLGGSDDNAGVTIVGKRKLRGNKVLNLITPFQKFEDDLSESYPYQDQLYADVCDIIDEVNQYITGKYGQGAQVEMKFDTPDQDEEF